MISFSDGILCSSIHFISYHIADHSKDTYLNIGCLFYIKKSEREIMILEMLQAKIHRATVTQAELNYVGSITIDEALLEASGIREYQKVQIVDIDNGQRFETYTIAGPRDSGVICLNGAAARCVAVGDKVIIMAYSGYSEEELKEHKPQVVFVDENNRVHKISQYEKHGRLEEMDE